MVLADYTHLLNYITWFNESSIQSKLNNDFGGNLTSTAVIERTLPIKLDIIRKELVATYRYMFNKPDVSSSTVEKVDESDVTIAAVWSGVSKDLIEFGGTSHIIGSESTFNIWKQRAWNNVHETGLFTNSFTYTALLGGESHYIGFAVSMSDVVIVVIIKTEEDNSVPPRRSVNPSDPSDNRGVCTDGLDIEVCDEEEDDDCEPFEVLCESNFQPAN